MPNRGGMNAAPHSASPSLPIFGTPALGGAAPVTTTTAITTRTTRPVRPVVFA